MLLSLEPLNLNTAGGKQTKVTFLNYTKIISIVNVCAEKNINLKMSTPSIIITMTHVTLILETFKRCSA